MIVKNLFKRKSKKPLSKRSGKYYDSIDNLPYWNWKKVNETGDYSYLIISGEVADLELVWFKIFDEYIKEVGLPEEYRDFLELYKEYLVLRIDFELTGNRVLLNFIQIKKIELDKKSKTEPGKDNTTAILSKFMGFPVKEKEVTVSEYYNYLQLAQQDGKNS